MDVTPGKFNVMFNTHTHTDKLGGWIE
jgi:hypothetical protein